MVTSLSEIPQTTAVCDGSGEEFSLLNPHLEVSLRPVRQVLKVDDTVPGEDADENAMESGVPDIYLATKAGRGVTLRFKDFDAAISWFQEREGKSAKLELHHEDEIPYAGGDGVGTEDDEGGE